MIPEISVHDLASWRDQGKNFVLLDVREPDEVSTARVGGSVWIPMAEVPQRLVEPRLVEVELCAAPYQCEAKAG